MHEGRRPTHAATIWIAQEMVDFIEDRLLEELSPAVIAAHFHISVASVGAVFKIAFDLSIMEYVRRRRLSRAAEELQKTRIRIIDLSYKYGYETPEAFTKAFTRFHGFPPGMVRRLYSRMRCFYPLAIRVELCGGFEKPTITDRERREKQAEIGYHGIMRERRGMTMKQEENQYSLHLADMSNQLNWEVLLALSKELDRAGIPHKVDGKTMIFAHGLDFELEKICLTFQWSDQSLVKSHFGYAGEIKATKHPGFRFFDTSRGGVTVRCMFYEGDSLYRNADIVNVDGQELHVQSLEFYLENAEPKDEFYEMVERHLTSKT